MLEHKHLIIRADVVRPPRGVEATLAWFTALVGKIGMKLVDLPNNPNCFYMDTPGNRGLTCVGIIETSHIALHAWDEDEPGMVQLDVYSCKDFDPEDVLDHLAEFEPTRVVYKHLDREHGLVELVPALA
ncbi:S-adenosylmethionine decarboxylase [Mucisphaera calidilacus]|uniref:S-adenosylmethionine decarboxylase proenzyme n=1 Tax=Mucisphaera calidilacus TaxID=2527982 RepID=A0A518C0X4_9BACT|nr:S-adenosylmethionine decarboxylase [Mucisphaera calidilacus]QDU72876.1 S-adenosylmethionine decarboxylase proenzyme [Mucisphaera calidilacus]